MPSSPIRLASGQAPVAEAASRPMISGLVRSGYSASVAGSKVLSRPKAMSGRTSQPNANVVYTVAVRSTAAPLCRSAASPAKVPMATRSANVELTMKETLAPPVERSALRTSRSFSWTKIRATTVPPRHFGAPRPGR